MFKSILAAVDIGHAELAKSLIDKALALRDEGGSVTLVYVLEDVPSYIAAEIPHETLVARRSEAEEDLRRLARAAGADVGCEVRSGSAAAGILDAAADLGSDLIMLASHRPDLRDYFIGSTAARVVRHAQCSVLVVR
jgi:nucleotide-binding universal stress UspA family protein